MASSFSPAPTVALASVRSRLPYLDLSPALASVLSLYLLAPPSALARPKPYQGVRVRDPVKELLRRKRSLALQSTKTAPPAVVSRA